MELLVLSYANNHNRNYYNYKNSLKKFGYKFKILGKNKKWSGFNTKISAYYNYLIKLRKKFNSEKSTNFIICITDCYDVLACNTPNKLLKKYNLYYKDKLLFGCEPNCLERNCIYISKYWNNKNNIPENKYLNSGFILGNIDLVLDVLKFTVDQYLQNGIDDDQLSMCYYGQKNPDKIMLDVSSSIISTIHYDLLDYEINNKGNVYNTKTKQFCSFIHTPGTNSDFSYRLDSIGKNILKDKYIDETKIKKISNFINNIKSNKIHKLYFIIILLILSIIFYFFPKIIFIFMLLIILLILKL